MHPLSVINPVLATRLRKVPQDRVKAVGWALLKDDVGSRQIAGDPVIAPLYGALSNNAEVPSDEELRTAWAEVEQREVDGITIRALIEGWASLPPGATMPDHDAYLTHMQSTQVIKAFVSLFQPPHPDRLLDIVQNLLNSGVEPATISERLANGGT